VEKAIKKTARKLKNEVLQKNFDLPAFGSQEVQFR
jgi:hypothetical protein